VGCPVIIKPPTNTPISALIMGRIATEAGAPPGSISVMPMKHEDVSLLLDSEDIQMVSFTGSPAVGWSLKERVHKKRITLELGGNSGTIVDASADIAWAARRCALGGFAQAGQSCIAVQRIYVHNSIYDAFLKLLIQEAGALKVGDPRQDDVVVGPVISTRAADRIMAWLEEALAGGAELACGGQRKSEGIGNVIEPTILTNVDEGMLVSCREIFGPVVTVTPFEETATAINWINQSTFGLQAAIFSSDLNHVQQAVERLEVGGVIVNDFPTYRVDHMPYGGVKDSGLGREGIRSTMLEMSEEKVVITCLKH
jgi:glyceraldehyde-3-phosphate dehydrogenase (NADP+)